jgi:predicted RNA-binding Zn ribbon-like protein
VMSDQAARGAVPAASHPNDRPPPMWVGGHIALDFLNSTAAPRGTPIEWIANGRDLVTWMLEAKALGPADAERILARFSSLELDRTAREAVDLREWFRDVLARAKAGGVASLPRADIDRLNAVLSHDGTYRRVETAAKGGGLRLVAERPWRTPGEVLAPLAAAMADLLCDNDLDLVRNCENPPCTMWFYDRTKGRRRRWCSQAVCGNRAKVAAFRERKRRGK